MPINTTGPEDRNIQHAKSHAEDMVNHVEVLIEIISRLDDQISRWKEVSGRDGPDELADKLNDLEREIERLENQIREMPST